MTLKKEKDGTITSHVKQKGEVLRVHLNEQDRITLDLGKEILEQPKDSTALKQLAYIGYLHLNGVVLKDLVKIVIENKRKNKRTGYDVEYM